MSDAPPADAPAADAAESDPDASEPKPAETVEFWRQKAREQEKRAKANADAAKRLTEIEEAQKSEAEKAADRMRQLEEDAATARREALRYKVASKFAIGEEDAELFLTASDEETLVKQAERLAGRAQDRKKQGNHVPSEGRTPPPPSESDERAAARALFGS